MVPWRHGEPLQKRCKLEPFCSIGFCTPSLGFRVRLEGFRVHEAVVELAFS